MPLSLGVYGSSANRRYAVVMPANTASTGWNGDGTDELSAAYQTRFDVQNSIGCRPYLVAPTEDGTYASVFRDDQIGPWQARHGLTPAQYQDVFNTLVPEGYFPIEVQGGGAGGGVRLAAVFTKTEAITPRTSTVTGSPASVASDPFDAAMRGFMTTYGVRQAALALVNGARLVLARAYTYAEPGYPIAEPTNAFRQESCSKTLVSILIHQLIHEGKLKLSDTLESILDLKAPGGGAPADPRFSKITVAQLLDQNSGLTTNGADATVVAAFPGAKLPITVGQLGSWLAGQPLIAAPGTPAAWAYNNNGYIMLGQIAATLRGSSFIGAVENHIAAPLSLKTVRLAVAPLSSQPADEARYTDITMPVVNSVVDADQRLVPSGYGDANFAVSTGGGGISASVVDMACVLAALNVTASSNPLLAPSEIQAMFKAAAAGDRAHGWELVHADRWRLAGAERRILGRRPELRVRLARRDEHVGRLGSCDRRPRLVSVVPASPHGVHEPELGRDGPLPGVRRPFAGLAGLARSAAERGRSPAGLRAGDGRVLDIGVGRSL